MANVGGIRELRIIRGSTTYIKEPLTPAQAELLAQRTGLLFTVKAQLDDGDDAAIIQIVEGGGLVRLNGLQPSNSSWASIEIEEVGVDVPVPTISLTIQAAATAKLTSWHSYMYHDWQLRGSTGVVIAIGFGRTYIVRDRTRVT
jgi:hypothetical protein